MICIDGGTRGRLLRFSTTAEHRVPWERPPVLIDVDVSNWTFENLFGCVCACVFGEGWSRGRQSLQSGYQ